VTRVARSNDRPGRRRPGLFACLLLATACGAAGFAQAQVTESHEYLAKMDADRDGRVSPVEYQDWMSYAFDGMDHDGDGLLSPAEQPGGRGRPITRIEHRGRIAARFNRQDADRDGYLSARELLAPPR
jgi:hypothetical protein